MSVEHEDGMMPRPVRFAAEVAARYGIGSAGDASTPAGVARVTRVFRRLARASVLASAGRFTFAPRISLRLVSLGRGAGQEGARARRSLSLVPREQPHTVSAASQRVLLERSGARARRNDGHGEHAVSAGRHRRVHAGRGAELVERSGAGAPAASMTRVLRRRGPAPSPPVPAPARDDWAARSSPQPARATPFSPVEMNRLTDHIMLTIDRRIAAFRERQGRV